jgi:hypothetical protein
MGKRPLMLSAALVALCLVLLGWRFQSSVAPVASVSMPAASRTDSAPSSATTALTDTKDSVEVCGRGTMAANDAKALLDSMQPVADQLDAQLLERLAQSADPAARALGLSLRALRIKDAMEQMESAPGVCAADACRELAARVQSDWQQLHGLAATSTDPYVYSRGRETCQWVSKADCGAYSALRLSQLDPGNAWVWLEVLDEAGKNKQAPLVRHGLEKFSQTRRFESGEGRTLDLMLGHASAPSDQAHAAMMDVVVLGRIAAIAMPSLQSLLPACKTGIRVDPQIRSLCLAAARNLTYESDTLGGSLFGSQLMQHMGVSGAELQAARDHAMAAMHHDTVSVDIKPGTGFSCSEVQIRHQHLLARAKHGEMPAIALAMQAEGITDAQAVRRLQEQDQQTANATAEKSRNANRLPF